MINFRYLVMVLATMMMGGCADSGNEVVAQTIMSEKMYITIDGVSQAATLYNNTATLALVAKLQQDAITVTLNSSGGFEIWGALGFGLPTSNEQMTAQPGDIVLYNGSNICMFYGSNSWSYTRLGHIDGLSANELRTFLKAGQSGIAVTLSLRPVTTGISKVGTDDQSETYYNLHGQQVSNPSSGIYVKNGKKIKL